MNVNKKNLIGSRWHWDTNMLAFPFLCKNPAVFASKNPRILFMAKRQKARDAVRFCLRSRTEFYVLADNL